MTSSHSTGDSTATQDSWWSQECGLRDVLTLGMPLVISTSSFAFMYFCDRLFLTWYSTLDMAAVMQASAFSWSTVAFPMGVATYAMAFVAQYQGAQRSERIGAIVWQAARIAIYAIPLFFLVALLCPLLFWALGHEWELARRETLYFRILAVGLPGMVLSAAGTAFFVGIERPRIVMLIDVGTAIVNVVLDYMMIFGVGGLPEMGLVGAGWATVIAIWLKVVLLIVLIRWQDDWETFGFGAGRAWDGPLLVRLLRFGGPNGLQFFLEGSAFTLLLLFMGRLGTLALAATTLAISVNLVAFIPLVGISMAVTTMVGNQIGRRRPDLARRATWNGVRLSVAYSGLFAIAYALVPGWFLLLHDLPASGAAELQMWAEFLLKFVAAYCLFDALQLVFASAIKGAGDTAFTVYTLAVATGAMLVLGILGEGYWTTTEARIVWWWSALTLFLAFLAVVFFVRFQQGKWEQMQVIESERDDGGMRSPVRSETVGVLDGDRQGEPIEHELARLSEPEAGDREIARTTEPA